MLRLEVANQTFTNHDGASNGIIPFNLGVWMSMAGFTAIAWWNVMELNFNVFITFKKRKGLYFWALLITSWGVVGHSLSLVFKFLTDFNPYWICTLLTLGWWAMVNGQSLVLWSRLHLVVHNWYVLRGVLCMIIIDGIGLCIPTSVATYGSSSDRSDLFLEAFRVVEKVQMTVFVIQETIISGIYVYFTLKMLEPALDPSSRRMRKTMLHLIWINLIIIAMDFSDLIIEYRGNYYIESTWKSVIYSVKLKIEFTVLNQLMRLSRRNVGSALTRGNGGALAPRGRSSRVDAALPAGSGDQPRGFEFGFTKEEATIQEFRDQTSLSPLSERS